MATQSTKGSLGDLPAAFMNLFNAQMKLSADLFESFTGQRLPTVNDLNKLGQQVLNPGATGCAPKASSCCTIPAPCWMPRSLGECVSHVGQCNNACIRFVVTNCDRVPRTITAQASGANAGKITISPPSVVLGPQERATISACVSIADNAQTGEKIETLVWLRGCKEYFFRWNVSVGTVGVDACHEIEVCDCPDYVHHWYDHFYCVRPCPTVGRTGVATNANATTLTPANG